MVLFPFFFVGKCGRDNTLSKTRAFCKLIRDGASCVVVEEFLACYIPQVSSSKSMDSPCTSFDILISRLSLTFINTSTY
jgi:hypothetical protein